MTLPNKGSELGPRNLQFESSPPLPPLVIPMQGHLSPDVWRPLHSTGKHHPGHQVTPGSYLPALTDLQTHTGVWGNIFVKAEPKRISQERLACRRKWKEGEGGG